MPSDTTVNSLSTGKRRLLRKLQEINFGWIENFNVSNGEPVFLPSTRVIHKVRFGRRNGPHDAASGKDYTLKLDVVELFREMASRKDGVVRVLKIQEGLPVDMEWETGVA